MFSSPCLNFSVFVGPFISSAVDSLISTLVMNLGVKYSLVAVRIISYNRVYGCV